MTFAVFGQTADFNFINLDDQIYVYENAKVAGGLSLKGLVWVFTHADCYLYHPLTMLSLMADYQLHGLHAGGYHLTNVLLHTASVILLFLILRNMTGALWRSAFVAAVFAIHPLRVESVAWVAERKDVLATFFFMLTLGAYVRYVHKPNSLGRYLLVAVAFVLALLSKPTAVTLPFVLLLLDYWPLQRMESKGKLVMEKLLLFALSAAACAMTVLAAEKGIAARANVSVLSRLDNAVVSYAIYLRQMVWPECLAVFYPRREEGYAVWTIALSFLLVAMITGAVLAFWRKGRWLVTGWLWYLGMLTPMIGVVQAGSFAHADRMTYLPQIGLYLLLSWTVVDLSTGWRHQRVALGGLAAIILVALGICAQNQTAYWKDSATVWKHTLACTTGNDLAHNGMGNDFLEKEMWADAAAQFQEALQISPDYAAAHNNLGFALFKEGRTEEAITQYQKALQIDSDYMEACNNLGSTLLQRGRVDEAIIHLQKALFINPDYTEAHVNLGNALLQKGSADEAILQYQKALQINPSHAKAENNLGNALRQLGKADEAISHYQKALQIKPDYADAHNNLGSILLQQGRADEAISQCREALKLNPDYAEAHLNLGNALRDKGQVDEAMAHFRQALRIKPDYADALNNLGNALRKVGKVDEAIIQYQKALEIIPDNADVHVNLAVTLLQRGRVDEAITQCRDALQINPANVKAHMNLGVALSQKGKTAEAITEYQEVLRIKPVDPDAQNNLAWLLATCQDASLRNGNKAVELARQANELTAEKNPIILHTLAAAFAEVGKFDDAKRSIQKAIELAPAAGRQDLAEQYSKELKRYEARLPLHE